MSGTHWVSQIENLHLKESRALRQPPKLLQAVLGFVGSTPASLSRLLQEGLRLSSHDALLAILDQLSAVWGLRHGRGQMPLHSAEVMERVACFHNLSIQWYNLGCTPRGSIMEVCWNTLPGNLTQAEMLPNRIKAGFKVSCCLYCTFKTWQRKFSGLGAHERNQGRERVVEGNSWTRTS